MEKITVTNIHSVHLWVHFFNALCHFLLLYTFKSRTAVAWLVGEVSIIEHIAGLIPRPSVFEQDSNNLQHHHLCPTTFSPSGLLKKFFFIDGYSVILFLFSCFKIKSNILGSLILLYPGDLLFYLGDLISTSLLSALPTSYLPPSIHIHCLSFSNQPLPLTSFFLRTLFPFSFMLPQSEWASTSPSKDH